MAAQPPQPEHPTVDRPAPVVLSIAGSDSGGGAGIAADLKAFARCGVHGAVALTAVTAQNTVAVGAIHELPAELILDQVRLVSTDMDVRAVKVGMLGGAGAASAVARALSQLGVDVPVVVDPVIFSSSGTALLTPEALAVLVGEILPQASVITPNVDEARALASAASGDPLSPPLAQPADRAEAEELLRTLLGLGPACVVLTGGHTRADMEAETETVVDLFAAAAHPDDIMELTGERYAAGGDHGSGCTHSAVLAAQLALGREPLAAARRARELTGFAIARGLRGLGGGNGPVDVLGLSEMRAVELGEQP